MTENTERRMSQAIFYDAINDRRRPTGERPALEWPEADPAIPGTIRPGVNDKWDGIERRRVPAVGTE